eukprot:9475436-Pyramimonas_sp.AAC.2
MDGTRGEGGRRAGKNRRTIEPGGGGRQGLPTSFLPRGPHCERRPSDDRGLRPHLGKREGKGRGK